MAWLLDIPQVSPLVRRPPEWMFAREATPELRNAARSEAHSLERLSIVDTRGEWRSPAKALSVLERLAAFDPEGWVRR
jgi:hypothetical protein